MIDAEKILEQVQQGTLPATWRIFRGKAGSHFVASMLTTIFTFIFIGAFLFIIYMAASMFGLLQSSPIAQPFNQSSMLPTNDFSPESSPLSVLSTHSSLTLLLVLIAAVVALAFGARVWIRTNKTRNSLLVLTPDGVVTYTNYERPEKRTFKAISYADLNDIEMKIYTSTSTSTQFNTDITLNTPTINTPITRTSTSTSLWLDMQYRDGHHERWKPDTHYERSETIVSYILADFARYGAREV